MSPEEQERRTRIADRIGCALVMAVLVVGVIAFGSLWQ